MGDKLLFTPGPLTTSPGVKQATLHDLGSRDLEFIELVHSIRAGLLNVAGVAGRSKTRPVGARHWVLWGDSSLEVFPGQFCFFSRVWLLRRS